MSGSNKPLYTSKETGATVVLSGRSGKEDKFLILKKDGSHFSTHPTLKGAIKLSSNRKILNEAREFGDSIDIKEFNKVTGLKPSDYKSFKSVRVIPVGSFTELRVKTKSINGAIDKSDMLKLIKVADFDDVGYDKGEFVFNYGLQF